MKQARFVFLLYSLTCAQACSTTNDTPIPSDIRSSSLCQNNEECDDNNACTLDLCMPTGCQNLAEQILCDDGDPCTVGDQCEQGQCLSGINVCACRTQEDCSDGNPCNGYEMCDTANVPYLCVPGNPIECGNTDQCSLATCDSTSGECITSSAEDGLPCNDNEPYTVDDTCQSGQCLSGFNVCECAQDSDCLDESLCNGAESCDVSVFPHRCVSGEPILCVGSGGCTTEECSDSTGTCEPENRPDGYACDDGAPCTVGDSCIAGSCTSGYNICECLQDTDCDDGNPCTGVETCNTRTPPYVCVPGIPILCETDNACSIAACEPNTGLCEEQNAPDGTGCDAPDECIVDETCEKGTCIGLKVCGDCTDNTECVSGACVNKTCVSNGDACGDIPPDGQCTFGHWLGCIGGQLSVSSCDSICGGCDGCVPECKLGTTGCSELKTHTWQCTKFDGCPRQKYTLCSQGCVDGAGCAETIDTDGDSIPNIEDSDDDNDFVDDVIDVCPLIKDDQTDTDNDGLGNACDADDDGDYVPDDVDNCPLIINGDQLDSDGDKIGDACESPDNINDFDNDNITDDVDNCPLLPNPLQEDTDDDGIGNTCDNCIDLPNPMQNDTDDDGAGNACDNCNLLSNPLQEDTDDDNIGNACDNCPLVANSIQEDTDDDGIGNTCDNCPLLENPIQEDTDDDGIGNTCDNCPLLENPMQEDTDDDNIGDACDIPEDADEPPEIVEVGTAAAIRLQGLLLTPTGAVEGEVLIVGDTIVCVNSSCANHNEAAEAWVINTKGVISPGLIDTHNHILFDVFDEDDWVPTLPSTCSTTEDCKNSSAYCSSNACACVNGSCKYTNHNDWPKESEYGLMLDYKQCMEDASQGKPDWCPQVLDESGDVKCEMQKWGELKGLIAGTTAIVGLPGTSAKCVSSLARSVDVSQNDLDDDKIQTSALFPPSGSSANGVCNNFADGDTNAYLIHVGEGTDQDALDEFSDLFTLTSAAGCLYSSKTAITHGTAFGPDEFSVMAEFGMNLIWSPASNNALYGVTTNIPQAIEAGITVALAPDWSMGGSQNILDEIRAADSWDNMHWGDTLSASDFFEMTTSNAAKALGLDSVLGHLEEGYIADIVVFSATGNSAYDAITAATPTDIRLVMVGGTPLFGDPALEDIVPATPGCEMIDLCGTLRFLCVAEDSSADKLDQTYAEIESALNNALLEIDNLLPVAPSNCGCNVDTGMCNGCDLEEECYAYQAKPEVDASLCSETCAPKHTCIQAKKSGSNQYQCLPTHTCSPKKSQKQFWPLTPVYQCPAPS